MSVPVQIPKTLNRAARRESLIAVCTVKKKFGPGVTTAMPQTRATLNNIVEDSMVSGKS